MASYETKEIFAKKLTKLLTETNETQAYLAALMHVAPSSVSGWCNGEKMPRMDKIEWIAEHFGVSRSYLLEDQTQKAAHNLPDGAFVYDLSKLHRIPILGRISAGLPIYAEENIEGYTFTDLNGGAEYFALKVFGDSMNAIGICEGHVLIVRRQEAVDNGDVAVVLVGDSEATVKRFYQTDTSVTLMPQSTNPTHKPQIYNPKETHISILGKVVKVEFTL